MCNSAPAAEMEPLNCYLLMTLWLELVSVCIISTEVNPVLKYIQNQVALTHKIIKSQILIHL